jgi:hypothetical protein
VRATWSRSREAAFGTLTDKTSIASGIVVGLLEKVIPNLGLKLDAEGSQITGATVHYGDVVEETTYEDDIDAVFDSWFRQRVTPKPGVRYFLVRDAYVAGSVSYDLTTTRNLDAEGELRFKRLFDTRLTILKHEGQSGYKLNQILDPPLRVCIRASEVMVTRDGDAGEVYRLSDRTGAVPPISRSLD